MSDPTLHVFRDDYNTVVAASWEDAAHLINEELAGEPAPDPYDDLRQLPDDQVFGIEYDDGTVEKTCAEWARERGRGWLGGWDS